MQKYVNHDALEETISKKRIRNNLDACHLLICKAAALSGPALEGQA
jgi:hypothetical protein